MLWTGWWATRRGKRAAVGPRGCIHEANKKGANAGFLDDVLPPACSDVGTAVLGSVAGSMQALPVSTC